MEPLHRQGFAEFVPRPGHARALLGAAPRDPRFDSAARRRLDHQRRRPRPPRSRSAGAPSRPTRRGVAASARTSRNSDPRRGRRSSPWRPRARPSPPFGSRRRPGGPSPGSATHASSSRWRTARSDGRRDSRFRNPTPPRGRFGSAEGSCRIPLRPPRSAKPTGAAGWDRPGDFSQFVLRESRKIGPGAWTRRKGASTIGPRDRRGAGSRRRGVGREGRIRCRNRRIGRCWISSAAAAP